MTSRLLAALFLIPACTVYRPTLPLPTDPHAVVLVSPPNRHRDGGVRRDDRAPPLEWDRLGAFDDAGECERTRSTEIARAPDDDTWALWSLSRCVTVERLHGARLVP
jgi:hypothetical protein